LTFKLIWNGYGTKSVADPRDKESKGDTDLREIRNQEVILIWEW